MNGKKNKLSAFPDIIYYSDVDECRHQFTCQYSDAAGGEEEALQFRVEHPTYLIDELINHL